MQTEHLSAQEIPATFERAYLRDHDQEHALLYDAQGELISARDGKEHSVSFPPEELQRSYGGTLIHNHPLGRPLSKDDLALAAEFGLTMRAFGINPVGENYVYLAVFERPDQALAETIFNSFDDLFEVAEQELSGQADKEGWSDEIWLQRARHLTNRWLAERFGFDYQRIQRDAPFSEATRYERKRLSILSSLEISMQTEVVDPLLGSILQSLHRHSAGGYVPLERLQAVRNDVNALVTKTMLGKPQQNGVMVPYSVQHGQVVPHSPYFKMLWSAMHISAQHAIDRHAAIMRKYLPDDLIQHGERATFNPVTSVHEMDELSLQYDPLHEWIGGDNKRLSDRIWNATGDMRRRLDDYLVKAIAGRHPVDQMARELEQFLVPGKGTYEAMRLARTEVAAAQFRAESIAANMNPFVESYSFFTAPEHRCCDNCDDVQNSSPYPKEDTAHLPPQHPNCICGVIWNLVGDVKAIVVGIQEMIKRGLYNILDFIGPLSKRFLDLLFRTRG